METKLHFYSNIGNAAGKNMDLGRIKSKRIPLLILAIFFLILETVSIMTTGNGVFIFAKTIILVLLACFVFFVIYYSPQKICQAVIDNKWTVLIAIICLGFTAKTALDCFLAHSLETAIGQYNLIFQMIMIPTVIFGLMGIYVWKLKTWQLYLLIGTGVGLGMMMVVPIGGVPDEITHINTAYRVSNVFLGIPNSDGRVTMRMDDMILSLQGYAQSKYANASGFSEYLSQLFIPLKDGTLEESATLFVPQEYCYVFAALGIALGRILQLGTYAVLMLGRIFNFAVFMVLTTYAVSLIPIGKISMFVLLLMPMTVQQGMSFSYDVFVNAFSLILIAYSVKIAIDTKGCHLKKYEYAIISVSSLWLFPLKGNAYFLVSILPWLLLLYKKYPLSAKTKKITKRILIISLILLSIIFVVWGLTGASSYSYSTNELTYYGTNPVEGYTISYFIAHPFEIFPVLYNTLQNSSSYYVVTFVGGMLGWLDIILPPFIIIVFYLLLFFASIKHMNSDQTIHNDIKKIFGVIGLFTVGFILFGLLISWSPISHACIEGVQGRYFIPVAMLFLILLFTDRLQIDRHIDTPIKVMTLMAIFYSVEFLMKRY